MLLILFFFLKTNITASNLVWYGGDAKVYIRYTLSNTECPFDPSPPVSLAAEARHGEKSPLQDLLDGGYFRPTVSCFIYIKCTVSVQSLTCCFLLFFRSNLSTSIDCGSRLISFFIYCILFNHDVNLQTKYTFFIISTFSHFTLSKKSYLT